MPIPAEIKNHLAAMGAGYEIISHPPTRTLEETAQATGVPINSFARTILLKDERGLVMAIVPVSHVLDFRSLRQLLGRNSLELARPDDFAESFRGCERHSYPPLGDLFGYEMVIDDSFFDNDKYYFEPGTHTILLGVEGRQCSVLYEKAQKGNISYPMDALLKTTTPIHYTPSHEPRRRLGKVYSLPLIPEVASEILDLRRQADASVDDLANLIGRDPCVADQIIRYACSPLFGYRGKVDSVRDAISRVLGFEMVMNQALGISIGRTFENPREGPIGLREFWRHATYCAASVQLLSGILPVTIRPQGSMAYLAGLMHNFGFLLLGYLFQQEFYLLNKLASANPGKSIHELEKRVLSNGRSDDALMMNHAEIGAWLLQAWDLPDEIVVAAREHHNTTYMGSHDVYVRLLIVTNNILKRHGIGDAASESVPVNLLYKLRITEAQAVEVIESVIESGDSLNEMAAQMAA